ncbi:MAG: hypothetical protein U0946_00640 [Patescibacteria group bacterium]|nr:hypothetical protein [Patescibacteria group bacterium]
MYSKRNTNYQKILLEQKRKCFRTADLGLLWRIENQNTLWMTIKRYLDREILYSIQRGLYSVVPIKKLDNFELGCAIAGPFSYVSGETVLELEGVIMQKVNKLTLFGLKRLEFSMGGREYLVRYLSQKYLINREGVEDGARFSVASIERAMADLLQINPKYYVDNNLAIDKNKVKQVQRRVGYL